MKPAPFDYYSPTSIDDAINTLDELGYSGKILAGGQSLVPAMNFRMAQPGALVDLNNINDLFYIKKNKDNSLSIGAMTRDTTVEYDPLVAEIAPIITEAMPQIAHEQIRNRGTFGGAIAHADPTGQLPAIAIALNAECLIKSKSGERWESVEDLIIGPFTTTLQPNEMLIEVKIPALPKRSGSSYKQISRQHGVAALVGVATVVTLDRKKRCENVKIVYLSVGEKPEIAFEAQKLLIGQELSEELINKASEIAVNNDISPGGDIHASAEYRRNLARVLTRDSLIEANERAKK